METAGDFILFLNYTKLYLVGLGRGQQESCVENSGAFAQDPIFSSSELTKSNCMSSFSLCLSMLYCHKFYYYYFSLNLNFPKAVHKNNFHIQILSDFLIFSFYKILFQ